MRIPLCRKKRPSRVRTGIASRARLRVCATAWMASRGRWRCSPKASSKQKKRRHGFAHHVAATLLLRSSIQACIQAESMCNDVVKVRGRRQIVGHPNREYTRKKFVNSLTCFPLFHRRDSTRIIRQVGGRSRAVTMGFLVRLNKAEILI